MSNVKISTKEDKEEKQEEDEEKHNWGMALCEASALHGMPYLARKDLHWIERIFWLAFIIAAGFYSIGSCLNQWERFRTNPIVYEYEYLFALRNFTFMGVTFCADYETEEHVNDLVAHLWHLNETEVKAAYYRQFLIDINRLRYNNLDMLAPYANDSTLEHLDFLQIVLQLQQNIVPKRDAPQALLAPIITEMGLCLTTSQLTQYGNPYGELESLKVASMQQCGFFNDCQVKFKPIDNSHAELYLYLHDVNDLMLPNDRRTLLFSAGTDSSYQLKFLLNSISAEHGVQNLPVAYRKCRYQEENPLKYFSPYRPSLCRLECRIDIALSLCQCKPFFYAAAPHAPICDIRGMLCLAEKHWLDEPCHHCLPLCPEMTFIITEEYEQSSAGQDYIGKQLERSIILKMELPKMGMKRRVVFSTDQLIMSFGGAIGLFLGASFMTIYGLINLFIYFLVVKCKAAIVNNQKRM